MAGALALTGPCRSPGAPPAAGPACRRVAGRPVYALSAAWRRGSSCVPPRRQWRLRDAPPDASAAVELDEAGAGPIAAAAVEELVEEGEAVHAALSGSDRAGEGPEPISLATLLKFTLPTLAIWLINPSLSLVDTAVVGMQSSSQLAAMGPGCILCDTNGYLFTFLAVATTNLMAVSIANDNQDQATSILSDALGIALALGLLFGAVTYALCPWMLARMTGNAPEVLAPAATYVKIRCLGAPAAFLMFVTNAFFLAAWDPLTPLRSAALSGAINLGLDVLLVSVCGWGIAGAAIATVAAQVAVAGMLLAAVRRPLPAYSPIAAWRLKPRWRLPGPRAVARFLLFAGPICFVLLTKTVMYNKLGSYSSSLGAIPSAASHVILTVFGFFAVFGDVISQAAQTFMPATISAPKKAQDLGRKLFMTGAGVGVANSGIAAGIVLFVPWLFTRNAQVVSAAVQLSPLLAGCLAVHTASLATEGMLLAGRDLGFLVGSYVANMALTIALLEFVVKPQALGVMGSYLCLLQFQVTRLLLNAARLVQSPASPLRTRQPLQPWLTEDMRASAA